MATLIGSEGADSLTGDPGSTNDALFGQGSADTLRGGLGNDYIAGEDGDDLIEGGGGGDTLLGGDGRDTFRYAALADCAGERLTDFMLGDRIDLTALGPLTFRADAPFTGTGGAEVRYRSTSVDNAAYAELQIDLNGDAVVDATLLVAGGEPLGMATPGFVGVVPKLNLVGGDGGDTLEGLANADTLSGGLGPDLLTGAAGTDLLVGGGGADTLEGGAGADTIRAATLAEIDGDVLRGIAREDRLDLAFAANYEFLAEGRFTGAANQIRFIWDAAAQLGTFGIDSDGDGLADRSFSVTGDGGELAFQRNPGGMVFQLAVPMVIRGRTQRFDGLSGGQAADSINGYGEQDALSGHGGDDTLLGGDGPDSLFGGSGNDRLEGGTGADYLQGGDGADTLTGGAQNDTFYFFGNGAAETFGRVFGGGDLLPAGFDVITDFAIGDRLTLFRPNLVFPAQSGSTAPNSVYLAGNTLEIDFDGDSDIDHRIRLDGVSGTLALDRPGSNTIIIATPVKVMGTRGPDHLTGNLFDDTISGWDGADTIEGFAGADSLDGGYGADLMFGGEGDDWMTGFGDTDTLYGGDGADTMLGFGGNDRMFGEAGADRLVGDGGNSLLDGGEGADTILGGAGQDTFLGGAGDDLLVFATADMTGAETLLDFAVGDVLDFSAVTGIIWIGPVLTPFVTDIPTGAFGAAPENGNVVVRVDANADGVADYALTLQGYTGGLLQSPGGSRKLIGVAGTAQSGSAAGETLAGGAGSDTVSGLGGADTVTGGTGGDTLLGGDGNDLLDGQGGEDSLVGGAGNDTLIGGTAIDRFDVSEGNDRIVVRNAAELAPSTVFGEIVTGFGPGDLLDFSGFGGLEFRGTAGFTGGTAQLRLRSEAGGTVLEFDADGNAAADRILTLAGYDRTLAEVAPDVFGDAAFITGSDGPESLAGGAGGDTINGLAGDDTLSGLGGADSLGGSLGNDKLFGGEGADTLNGGQGADTLTGGSEADRFVYTNLSTGIGVAMRDVITDFTAGSGDRIDLTVMDANLDVAGNQDFAFIGSAAFSDLGQLRYAGGVLQGNTTGSLLPDFHIVLMGAPAVTAADLVL